MRSVFIALVFVLLAQTAKSEDLPPFEEGVHERLIERVNEGQTREYRTIVEGFTRYLTAHPDDVVAAVELCRFMDHFANPEELVIEEAPKQSEECTEKLKHGNAVNSAPVQLYLLDQDWGDDAIKTAEALVKTSSRWTPKQRAHLHELLSTWYAGSDDLKSGVNAWRAVSLDPDSSSRIEAAEYLVRIGAKAAAIRTVQEMPPKSWQTYTLSSAVKLLVGLNNTAAANRLVDENATVGLDASTQVMLARALFAVGARDAAQKLVKKASTLAKDDSYISNSALRELFTLQLEYGSADTASTAYRKLRDSGYWADPFGRHRLSLLTRYPGVGWTLLDVASLGAFLLLLAICAALPLLIIVPLHYRSVVKQLRGKPPAEASGTSPWTFRHAWYALAVLLTAGTAAVYFLDYPTFHSTFAAPFQTWPEEQPASNAKHLGNALLIASTLSALALLPLLRGVNLKAFALGQWTIKRSVFTGLGVAILLQVLNALWRIASRSLSTGAVLGTDTSRAMQGISGAYGVTALLLYAAVLVPIVEEFVFRGVLLRTLSRYFALWMAAIVQAGVFVIFHESPSAYPYIAAIALCAAWLVHRSGGLLAAFVLHAVNNSLAVLSLVMASRFFENMK